MTLTVKSFAKINLGLRIGHAREDGFHELLTVYQTIGLHDLIQVSIQRGSGIEIRCADPRVPQDETNTCFRIAEKVTAALGVKGRVIIEIEKRLPVQGGLGGASANAVATLLGLERAARKPLPQTEKLQIAAAVGSDLPLFLVGGTVLGVGRGEQVFPLPDFPATACVMVTPAIGVSTPKAFREWDRIQALKSSSSEAPSVNPLTGSRQAPEGASSADMETASARSAAGIGFGADAASLRLAGMDEGVRPYTGSAKLTASSSSDRISGLGYGLSAWLSEWYSGAPSKVRGGRAGNPLLALVRAGIENDFEQVVFPEHPELGEVKRALVRAGAKYASLSGSGSSLYGLFASQRAAALAATRLRKAGWVAQATSTLTRREYWRRLYGT
jgi:4-diphosphocytidyl-2-C-methyl-D-erythritol kinase